jgi:hypothetical protein
MQITEEQIKWVDEFIEKNKPHWKRRFFSNFEATRMGMIAEVVIRDLLKLPRPKVFADDYDGGYDLKIGEVKYDVKNTGTDKGVVLISKRQLENGNETDAYIFTRTNNNELTILGTIYRNQVESTGQLILKGNRYREITVKTDDYIIDEDNLKPFGNYGGI